MILVPWKKKSDNIARLFRNEIDSFFNDNAVFENDGNYFISPKMDVSESKDKFEVSAEMPGLSEKDVDINIENNYLTISGQKRSEIKQKEKNYICKESSYESFQRSLKLPDNIDSDNIKASFKSGVLHLDIPKKEIKENKVKKIQVNK